jgi:isocitrate dehydrogenase
LKLTLVSNRGVAVWPRGHAETFCSDHWRCRFMSDGSGTTSALQIISLLGRVANAGYDAIKTENLYTFDGEVGFSLSQGE